jgi:hypothetical protein
MTKEREAPAYKGAHIPTRRDGVWGVKAAWEIEPGRGVKDDWDTELVEPWSQRKARRGKASA